MTLLLIGSFLLQVSILLLGVLLFVTGYRWYRLGRLIRDTPTSKPGTLAAGRVEVQGRTRAANGPIDVPFLEEDCLYADWTIEENVADEGEKWVNRASATRIEPFYLEDKSGRVLVRADKMEDIENLYWEFESRRFTEDERAVVESAIAEYATESGAGTRTNPATTERPDAGRHGTTAAERNTERAKWRFIIRFLPAGQQLYVFGSAEPQYGYSELGIEPDGPTGTFLIGRGNETLMSYRSYYVGMLSMAAGGLFILLGGGTASGLLPGIV